MSVAPDSADLSDANRRCTLECDERVAQLEGQIADLSYTRGNRSAVAMAVHEVAQPVTAASNFLAVAEALLSRPGGSANGGGLDAVRLARGCLVRAGEIMGSVRRGAEGMAFDPGPQELSAIVEEATRLFEFEAATSISIDIPSQASIVIGDRVQLGQVFANLIRNALEATAGEGTPALRIASRRTSGGFVEVRVEDNGPGMSQKMRRVLFSISSTTKPDGMGLGLSICRTIIEEHHGNIWLDEAARGTAFCFTLPSPTTPSVSSGAMASRRVSEPDAPNDSKQYQAVPKIADGLIRPLAL